MKTLLTKNWSAWRVTRLLFSLLFIGMGAWRYDTVLVLGGTFLLFHALLNTCGLCVGGTCEVKPGDIRSAENKAGN